jgi:hypothetical protein
MSSVVVPVKTALPCAASDENNAASTRAYRTKVSFFAVHLDEAGIPFSDQTRAKGRTMMVCA